MRGRDLVLCLLAGCVLFAAPALADDGFAPEQPGPPPVRFRLDFKTAWGVTDGSGMIDHVALDLTVGPQIGDAKPGGPPAISPLFGVTGGMAEEGQPSLRLWGGAEFSFGLNQHLELVPGVFGGWMKAWKGDQRVGPMFRATVGLRVLSKEDFFIVVEPVALVVLPAPPDGFTRYTTHVSLDMGIVKFGGRTR